MKGKSDPYQNYVTHPRYGKRPRLTGLSPRGGASDLTIPGTGIIADVSRQVDSVYQREFYSDEHRICIDCKRPFIFFAEEQKHWYEELRFNLNANCVRCVQCRKDIQTPIKLKKEYDRLIAAPNRSPEEDLRVAELCLDLIECRSFSMTRIETVRRLIKSFSQHPGARSRRDSIVARVERLEAERPPKVVNAGEIPSELLDEFPPSDDILHEATSSKLTTAMLHEISNADYGFDAKEHFKELKRLRDVGFSRERMDWHPHEVLALSRWSEPDQKDVNLGSTGERGHRIRAFCCAALLTSEVSCDSQELADADSDTLIQLIDSAFALQDEIPQATIRFLLYAIPRQGIYVRAVLIYGLIVLVLDPTVTRHPRTRLADFLRYVEYELDACDGGNANTVTCLGGPLANKWRRRFIHLQGVYQSPKLNKLFERVKL